MDHGRILKKIFQSKLKGRRREEKTYTERVGRC
jgi:hypothetical protein